MYRQRETIDADLTTIASNAPRLLQDVREITEGEVAYIRAMKCNKSPGSAGYISEFYQFSSETLSISWFALSIMDLKICRCR